MDRKLDNLMSLGCLTLVAIIFINCSIAMTETKLDEDLTVDLVADEVKEDSLKRVSARTNKAGTYIQSFLTLKHTREI